MRTWIRSSTPSRISGAVAGLWLCGTGAAWAGGGASLASLQSIVNDFCNSAFITSCPQFPTVTQAVLEIAGLGNTPPEMIRSQNSVGPSDAVTAGNAPQPAPTTDAPLQVSTLTPLAFVSASTMPGQAVATQLYNPAANAFFYAVTTGSPAPDTVHFFYEDLFRTNPTFTNGQIVAEIWLPLTILNNGVESLAVTKLQVKATCTGSASDCVKTATATGSFPGSGVSADKLNLTISASFAPSSALKQPHLLLRVDTPLVITSALDSTGNPAFLDFFYFFNLNSFVPTAFTTGDVVPLPPTDSSILGPGASIGLAPYPPPTCPGNAQCSGNPPPTTFGFCASLPDNSNGPNAVRHRAVGAFLVIANSGETLVSAPVPPAPPGSPPIPTCP